MVRPRRPHRDNFGQDHGSVGPEVGAITHWRARRTVNRPHPEPFEMIIDASAASGSESSVVWPKILLTTEH